MSWLCRVLGHRWLYSQCKYKRWCDRCHEEQDREEWVADDDRG